MFINLKIQRTLSGYSNSIHNIILLLKKKRKCTSFINPLIAVYTYLCINGWLVGVLWHINSCVLFNTKSCFLYTCIFVLFYFQTSCYSSYLHTVKWFQVFLSNTDDFSYRVFLFNKNNLHIAVCFQITNNNNT